MLESRLEQKRKLIKGFSGNPDEEIPPLPEATEIADLREKSYFSAKAIQAEIDNLKAQMGATYRPVDAQIAELKGKKIELRRQNNSLKVTAQFNGRIGSIFYKPGDLVPAFQPIMSVHSSMPLSVKGYIHENIFNEVQVGQNVWVKPITLHQNNPPLEGVVVSLGNRIVEYPERIKKDPMINAWGREVVVRLSRDNSLLFGEKVDVLLNEKTSFLQKLLPINKAEAGSNKGFKTQHLQELQPTNSDIDVKSIEASGLLWNPEANHYLLISDEQYDEESGIFILDKDVAVTGKLTMQDDLSIDDLESISTDGEYIYVSSSLSYNKKGKLNSKRKKLLRFKYRNDAIISQQEIDLFEVLTAVKDAQAGTQLAMFLNYAMSDQSIDIESHFVRNNALYLGFKAPLADGRSAVIIKLDDLEAIFAGGTPSAEIWRTLTLTDPDSGEPTSLSDMLLVDDRLLLLSVSRGGAKKSYLWSHDLKSGALENIQQFNDAYAEGLAYRPDEDSLVIVFDEGKDTISKYRTVKLCCTAQSS